MAYYMIKVTTKDGWLRPPIVANFPNEQAAIDAVRSMVDPDDTVEVKGLRDDVVKAAFGDSPEGTVVSRADWTWDGDRPRTVDS